MPFIAYADKLDDSLKALDKGETKKGLQLLVEEFKAGNGEAGFYLGRMSESGLGIPVNLPQAIQFYKKASEDGSPKALNRLGLLHYNGIGVLQNYSKAHTFICEAADLKDVEAQFNCATSFFEGKGVEKNTKQAESYFLMAANQDHIGAMNILAGNYSDGGFGEKDIKKSISYYEKTAAKGNPIGQYKLGVMFEAGVDLPKNLLKAHMYFNLANVGQHPQAANSLQAVTAALNSEELMQAQKMAESWQPENTPTKP